MLINEVVTMLSFFVLKARNAVRKNIIASRIRSVIQAFVKAVEVTGQISKETNMDV